MDSQSGLEVYILRSGALFWGEGLPHWKIRILPIIPSSPGRKMSQMNGNSYFPEEELWLPYKAKT